MRIYKFFAYDRRHTEITDEYYFDSFEKAVEFQKEFESDPDNEVFTSQGFRGRATCIAEFDLL